MSFPFQRQLRKNIERDLTNPFCSGYGAQLLLDITKEKIKEKKRIEHVKSDLFEIFAIDQEGFEKDPNRVFLLDLMLRQFKINEENYPDFILNTMNSFNNDLNLSVDTINFVRILSLLSDFSQFKFDIYELTIFQQLLFLHHLNFLDPTELEQEYSSTFDKERESSSPVTLINEFEDPNMEMFKQAIHSALALFNEIIVPMFGMNEFNDPQIYITNTQSVCSWDGLVPSIYLSQRHLRGVNAQGVIFHELMHSYNSLNQLGRRYHIFRSLHELTSMVVELEIPGSQIEYTSYPRLHLLLQFIKKNEKLKYALINSVNNTGDISGFYRAFVEVVREKSGSDITLPEINKLFLDLCFVKCSPTMKDQKESDRLFGLEDSIDNDPYTFIYKSPYHLARDFQQLGLIPSPMIPTTDSYDLRIVKNLKKMIDNVFDIPQIIDFIEVDSVDESSKNNIDFLKSYFKGVEFQRIKQVLSFVQTANILMTSENSFNVKFLQLVDLLQSTYGLINAINNSRSCDDNQMNSFNSLKDKIEKQFAEFYPLIEFELNK